MGFEPIPGLDYLALETEIERECAKALTLANIAITTGDAPLFLVYIDHAWSGSSRNLVALNITLQIRLEASPVQSFGDMEARKRSLAVWDNSLLRLVPADQAREVLLEELESLLSQLTDDIQAARLR